MVVIWALSLDPRYSQQSLNEFFFLTVVRATSVPSCFCFLTCHMTSIMHPLVCPEMTIFSLHSCFFSYTPIDFSFRMTVLMRDWFCALWACLLYVLHSSFFTPLRLCPGGRACADPAFGRRECTWQELADASSRGSRQQGSALCWASNPTVEQCERVRPWRTNCPAPRRPQRTHPGIIETLLLNTFMYCILSCLRC